jgi:hypothetical protein
MRSLIRSTIKCAVLGCTALLLCVNASAREATLQSADAKKTLPKPITALATVDGIDLAAQALILRPQQGKSRVVFAGRRISSLPGVKRGDTVKVTYYEPTLWGIIRPGETAPALPTPASGATLPSDLLTGLPISLSRMQMRVAAVDPQSSSVRVRTTSDRELTLRALDRAMLDSLKPGEQVEMAYTEAALVSIEPAGGK